MDSMCPEQEHMDGHETGELQVTGEEIATQGEPGTESTANRFVPYDLSKAPIISSGLPPEIWVIVQSAPANFPPQYFLEVNRDLLENPNLTASHLARAELSYQSFTDATFNPKATTSEELASIVKHLRPECRPQLVKGGIEHFELEWTVVRKLIPRNPKLDDALMQTCHLYTSHQDITITGVTGEQSTVKAERYLIIYIPHVSSPEEIPFYHPKVQNLAMLYTFLPNHHFSTPPVASPGTLSIYYSLFASYPLDNRLSRTALKLLEVVHKHSRGNQAGYKKRVQHDQIIGQKTFQDMYAYLKGKYAKELIEGWVEQTPAEKHVFEDLGIAAFLMELWVDMYGPKLEAKEQGKDGPVPSDRLSSMELDAKREQARQNFPGFVDIGCGNGLLVYILNREGWHGWGFDARKRKTWDTFAPQYRTQLKELLLVPQILQLGDDGDSSNIADNTPPPPRRSHNGVFAPHTFIISNHADELTPWTPLLAYLSSSPFIAIPCCSHDFTGIRFRAPVHAEYLTTTTTTTTTTTIPTPKEKHVKGGKQPSAYASLCSWISHLTHAVGYTIEKEFLRIPSTRNIAIVGRHNDGFDALGITTTTGWDEGIEQRLQFTRGLVEENMGGACTIHQMWKIWMQNGESLSKPGKGGH